jgi:small neutral amino acid transporter SnatA (MarC family)
VTVPYARIAAVLLVAAGCWVVWLLGGMIMDWTGLDDLDLIGRVVLIFAFLTVCQTGLERFSSAFNPGHQQ